MSMKEQCLPTSSILYFECNVNAGAELVGKGHLESHLKEKDILFPFFLP